MTGEAAVIRSLLVARVLAAVGFAIGATLPVPAVATVVAYRATGSVESLLGNTSLLPLPALVGDDFVLEFSYDDTVADTIPGSPNAGNYPILTLVVSITGQELAYADPGSGGVGAIGIQANSAVQNLWGVSACLPTCSNVQTYDTARLNLFFPTNTILSDALTPPPDPGGATVQFGLFSRGGPSDEAFLIASLDAITAVPEPAVGAAVAVAALAALSARRARAR